MKNRSYVIALIFVTLGLGCATARVRPYVGEQQSWPTASGSIVNTSYDLPVFTSLPPSPYEVLAELRIDSPFYATPEEGHMPKLIEKAKEIGADALLFVQGRLFFSTNYGPRGDAAAAAAGGQRPTLTQVNTFNPESFRPDVTVLAIKWEGEPPPGLPRRYEKKQPAPASSEVPMMVPQEAPPPPPAMLEPMPMPTPETTTPPPVELPEEAAPLQNFTPATPAE